MMLNSIDTTLLADPDQKENLFDAGLARFLKDIGVSDDGLESLALSWRLDCQEQGTISRKEFVEGFAKLGCRKIAIAIIITITITCSLI